MGIISEEKISKLGKIRKYLFRVAIWLLIAGVVIGVLLILLSDQKTISEIISKTMGTIFLVAAMMIVSVINFRLIESRKSSVQVFATISLCTSVLWVVLWGTAIWAWRPLFYSCTRDEAACTQYINRENSYARRNGYSTISECPSYVAEDCDITFLLQLTAVITYISAYGLVAALIMNMYEGRRRDLILPLKIVSVVLLGYMCFYGCLMTLLRFPSGLDKLGMLAGFASAIWFVVVLVAWIISHVEKNRSKSEEDKKVVNEANTVPLQQAAEAQNNTTEALRPKTDEELRVEIEEQVRREMIEKEVRARLEREMTEKDEMTVDQKNDTIE